MKTTTFILIIYFLPLFGFSQSSVEFTIGVGGTFVDIESVLNKMKYPVLLPQTGEQLIGE